MSQPMLTLSEHELYFLPPGTPATAPASRVEVEVDGEKIWFLARIEFSETLREHGCDHYLVFYRKKTTRNKSIFANSFTMMIGQPVKSEQEKISWIRQAIQQDRKQRFWHPKGMLYGISLPSYGKGSVVWRNEGQHVCSEYFDWGRIFARDEFLNWSQHDFVESCQQIHADKTSQLHGAIEWNGWSPERKDAIAFGCENGEWETLRRLFGCAQKLIVHHCGGFPNSKDRSLWHLHYKLGQGQIVGRAEVWMLRWKATLCEILRPSFWPNEPTYICQWRHKLSAQKTLSAVRCGIPTHHEVLEAQLELREFLRPHLSDDEIEALMRPE